MDTWKQRQQMPIRIVAIFGNMMVMYQLHAVQVFTVPAYRPDCLV